MAYALRLRVPPQQQSGAHKGRESGSISDTTSKADKAGRSVLLSFDELPEWYRRKWILRGYRHQLTLRSTVGYIYTMSRLTSIPTLSQPFHSYMESGISYSTLLVDTLRSLAPILLLSLSSCLRRSRACPCRRRTTP